MKWEQEGWSPPTWVSHIEKDISVTILSPKTQPAPAPEARRRILVVDDEEMLLLTLESYLRAAGYEVVAVDSGTAALACLARERIDLVLTDHDMPGMTGAELALVVKHRWPALPVVMLTGSGLEEPASCLDMLLRKPDDLYLLIPTIQDLIGPARA